MCATRLAATSSGVLKGLDAQTMGSAPPALIAVTRFAVLVEMCRHTPTRRLRRGCSRTNRSFIARKTGIWRASHAMRAAPASARSGSRMSDSMATVIMAFGAWHVKVITESEYSYCLLDIK